MYVKVEFLIHQLEFTIYSMSLNVVTGFLSNRVSAV